MANVTIVKEKTYGQYEYINDINVTGDYEKDQIEKKLTILTGICYSLDNSIFYGSFNSLLKDGELDYVIYETESEYKDIIYTTAKEIESLMKTK